MAQGGRGLGNAVQTPSPGKARLFTSDEAAPSALWVAFVVARLQARVDPPATSAYHPRPPSGAYACPHELQAAQAAFVAWGPLGVRSRARAPMPSATCVYAPATPTPPSFSLPAALDTRQRCSRC